MQCLSPCHTDIWKNNETFDIDFDTMRSRHTPTCPQCLGTARPNILMFGDYSWIGARSHGQEMRFDLFQEQVRGKNIVVIEMGAGSMVPTIRYLSERLGGQAGTTVIRINPREPQIGRPHLSLSCGALAALREIDDLLAS
jgi:NAD-dependent SIR2 family protein deacetylase